MVFDIALAIGLALVTGTLGYLGVQLTLHPPTSDRTRTRYKQCFILLTLLGIVIVAIQGIRTGLGQRASGKQIASLQREVIATEEQVKLVREEAQKQLEAAVQAKAETYRLRAEVQVESARRQQAEKDLARNIKSTGESTRAGVVEDIKKSPIQAGQAVMSAYLWRFEHTPPTTTFTMSVENSGTMRTNATITPSLFVDGEPHPIQNNIKPEIPFVPQSDLEIKIPLTLTPEQDADFWTGKSEVVLQLMIDYPEQPGGKPARYTYRNKFDVTQKRMISESKWSAP